MKYKDYYAILGVARDADDAAIKKAYRKLARKFHPDVTKDPQGEAKFKDLTEAYQTLKDKERRAAYDQLGSHPIGEEFQPSRDWGREFNQHFNNGESSFEGIDLSDLFAGLSRGGGGGRSRANTPIPGEDFEVATQISVEDAFAGTQVKFDLTFTLDDGMGRGRRESRTVEARIPKGATNGQRLRLRGRGGKGHNGGRDGDLYLNITLKPHPIFRVDGHDLYLDLPLAPWEAALGGSVEVPTPAGPVQLTVTPATAAGRRLRLAKRGLPKPGGGEGDLFALVKIVLPATYSDRELALYAELAEVSTFRPREPMIEETAHVD